MKIGGLQGPILVLSLPLLMACVAGSDANANGRTKSNSHLPKPFESSYWYDGDTKRQVWINPDLVMEFNPSEEGALMITGLSPLSELVPSPGSGIRLWRLHSELQSASFLDKLQHASKPQGRKAQPFSPVLHDIAAEGGPMRGLPGNILVILNPKWNEEAVQTWLKAHGFQIVRRFQSKRNFLELQTNPGLEGLQMANALYESGEVLSATPNWWLDVHPQ